MSTVNAGICIPVRVLSTIWLFAYSMALLNPLPSVASEGGNMSARFDEVVSLRGQGEYARVIEILRDIIFECEHADEISRQAYNYLVLMIWDETESKVAAEAAAREALDRFPDISADPSTFPQRLNLLYEELREGAYGTEAVRRAPRVSTDDESALEHPGISSKFTEVASLWKNGQYEVALAGIREMIDDYRRPGVTARRAYNYLVITVWDVVDRDAAALTAQEALEAYPGLEADTMAFPPKLNSLYAEIRGRIFGGLYVEADPESCYVFLDDEPLGKTPLDMPYVPVGEHDLLVKKPGYRDYSKAVEIRPGTDHRIEDVRLSRTKDWWWWTWRVGGPAAALFAVGVLAGGQTEKGEEDLPDRPPPCPGCE